MAADDPDIEAHSGLVVLALGKHGANELNYSSDIDLIVFYDPASAAIPEGAAPGPLYVRLTQALARLLQERTFQGYVLRVDLRLRPDPGATPVAMSIVSAAAYYERLGRTGSAPRSSRRARSPATWRSATPFSTSSPPSSGANISTTPRSPTSMR